MPKVIKSGTPNPQTGMCDMWITIEPGDRVVLIRDEGHCSLGWGTADDNDRVTYWNWIEGAFDIDWGEILEVAVDADE